MAFAKLKITGSQTVGGSGTTVEFDINPETIKHSRKIELREQPTGNTKETNTQFGGLGAQSLDFTLELENTGALEGSGDIEAKISSLSKAVYEYQGGIHRSNYAKIEYSGFVFIGQLETFSVDYKLFDESGKPIRASVALKFQSVNEVGQKPGGGSGNQSPDMTHGFTIREGDSLPNLCNQVYGKMDYYMAVAEHNGLTNFRDLEIGSVIEFPPMER